MLRQINSHNVSYPVAGSFRIAHGTLSAINVVEVSIRSGDKIGRGECRPYPRYGESVSSVMAQIETLSERITLGLTRQELQKALPAGAARNAVDCALWDLEAKLTGQSVAQLLGLPAPKPMTTAYTLSIDSPSRMAKAALNAKAYGILKLKIADMGGLDCALAVMRVRPDAQLIVDANEALTPAELSHFQSTLAAYPVLMIEQPIPAHQISGAPQDPLALPILCADEALHTRADLEQVWNAGYRAINIKLDKCGGLTEGLALIHEAKSRGFVIMAGCMVGSSLAMAPMVHLAGLADVVDLDGPALLQTDCAYGLDYSGDTVGVPGSKLWGHP